VINIVQICRHLQPAGYSLDSHTPGTASSYRFFARTAVPGLNAYGRLPSLSCRRSALPFFSPSLSLGGQFVPSAACSEGLIERLRWIRLRFS